MENPSDLVEKVLLELKSTHQFTFEVSEDRARRAYTISWYEPERQDNGPEFQVININGSWFQRYRNSAGGAYPWIVLRYSSESDASIDTKESLLRAPKRAHFEPDSLDEWQQS